MKNSVKLFIFTILFVVMSASVICVAENIEIDNKSADVGDTVIFNLSIMYLKI